MRMKDYLGGSTVDKVEAVLSAQFAKLLRIEHHRATSVLNCKQLSSYQEWQLQEQWRRLEEDGALASIKSTLDALANDHKAVELCHACCVTLSVTNVVKLSNLLVFQRVISDPNCWEACCFSLQTNVQTHAGKHLDHLLDWSIAIQRENWDDVDRIISELHNTKNNNSVLNRYSVLEGCLLHAPRDFLQQWKLKSMAGRLLCKWWNRVRCRQRIHFYLTQLRIRQNAQRRITNWWISCRRRRKVFGRLKQQYCARVLQRKLLYLCRMCQSRKQADLVNIVKQVSQHIIKVVQIQSQFRRVSSAWQYKYKLQMRMRHTSRLRRLHWKHSHLMWSGNLAELVNENITWYLNTTQQIVTTNAQIKLEEKIANQGWKEYRAFALSNARLAKLPAGWVVRPTETERGEVVNMYLNLSKGELVSDNPTKLHAMRKLKVQREKLDKVLQDNQALAYQYVRSITEAELKHRMHVWKTANTFLVLT